MTSATSKKPLWQEPIVIGIGAVVLLASLGVLFQDRILAGHPLNPGDKTALPVGGGGGFCDIPAPVKSTAFNPSTRKSETTDMQHN